MEDFEPPVRTSVLIISRNEIEPLRRTLASLAAISDPASIEVIVVDNASTDGSAAIDGEFPSVKMLRMQKNFGWTKAVNVGTRTAKGEFLCLTPVGVEFAADTIPSLEKALLEEPSALAVCPLVTSSGGELITEAYPLPNAAMIKKFWNTGSRGSSLPIDQAAPSIRAEYVVNSPMLMRRQSMAGMNYLDERYGQFWSDAEICFQIRRAGKSILVLPRIRVTKSTTTSPISLPLNRWSAQLSADAAVGGAAYLGKHSGFGASLGFRLSAVSSSAISALSFSGPKIKRFMSLLTGQKIDGTQGK